MSNRWWACTACGELRRLPKPPVPEHPIPGGLGEAGGDADRAQRGFPIPYGHWRSWDRAYPAGYELPEWFSHCGKPLFLLGKRASQAAGLLSAQERVGWIAKGARVVQGRGKKPWRPAVSDNALRDAYPLP